MTDFEKAMDEYFDHFGESYPYAVPQIPMPTVWL